MCSVLNDLSVSVVSLVAGNNSFVSVFTSEFRDCSAASNVRNTSITSEKPANQACKSNQSLFEEGRLRKNPKKISTGRFCDDYYSLQLPRRIMFISNSFLPFPIVFSLSCVLSFNVRLPLYPAELLGRLQPPQPTASDVPLQYSCILKISEQ